MICYGRTISCVLRTTKYDRCMILWLFGLGDWAFSGHFFSRHTVEAIAYSVINKRNTFVST